MTELVTPSLVTGQEREGIERLFHPGSIAVVGASLSSGKLGSVMYEAVAKTPDVDVYGINPKADNEHFYRTLSEATASRSSGIDLAVLCVPAAATPTIVREAAECGVGAVLICSGGFAESGPEGTLIQEQIAEISKRTGLRILGPNTSGFFRPGSAISVSFVPTVGDIAAGNVAVVAASGGMNHALAFLLSERGAGVSLGVGLGNSVDVTTTDVLNYLQRDATTTAVALHVESVHDGPSLVQAVRRLTRSKPVAALVVGQSDVSAFSESHTGALATSWRTTRALLAEAGAVIVDSEEQLVDALTVLRLTRLPANNAPGIALVTAQAGPGLLILDKLLSTQVSVPSLSHGTQEALSGLLPPMTFQRNPIDTGRPAATFPEVVAAAASDTAIDAVAVYALAEPDAVDLADAVRRSGVLDDVPVIVGTGGPSWMVQQTAASAAELGIAVYASPSSLAAGVAALVRDAQAQARLGDEPTAGVPDQLPPLAFPVDEAAAKDLLDALGVTTPQRRVCRTHAECHQAFLEMPSPVAVKILDATVLHKTDIGGVHLGIRSDADLDAALDNLDAIDAPAYLVETMAAPGVDLFLGVRRDPVFGPIVVAGVGGVAAEALGDVTIRSAQLTTAAAGAMLNDLQCAPLLDGWRGGPSVNRDRFAAVAIALARYLSAHPEVADIEINPLRITKAGLIALDAVVLGESTATNHGESR